MFVLAEFSDTIGVLPRDLSLSPREAVVKEINNKYAGKVFHNVGLCIKNFDLLDAGDSIVQHSTGSVYVKVRFRMVVFRPFEGEVFLAQIIANTPTHIQLGLGFFNDIYVHPQSLPSPSYFNNTECVWVWDFNGSEMFYDIGEVVRVQARHLSFKQIRPLDPAGNTDPKKKTPNSSTSSTNSDVISSETETEIKNVHTGDVEELVPEVPLMIYGDMSVPGLGPAIWWPSESPLPA